MNEMKGRKVYVIGAGFCGLSSAALLAKEGFDVTVLEKNDRPGGRAMVWKKDGFTFDMGPSWYMMLEAFDKLFAQFGKKPEDYYETIRLNPHYRVFFSKDESFDIMDDMNKNYELFDTFEKAAQRLRHLPVFYKLLDRILALTYLCHRKQGVSDPMVEGAGSHRSDRPINA